MARRAHKKRPATQQPPLSAVQVQQENLRRFTLKSWATSAQVLSARRDLATILDLLGFLHWLGDKNVEAIKRNHPPLPCKAGCAWCCYVGDDRPDLLPAELPGIVAFLSSSDPAGLAQVKDRLQAARHEAAQLDEAVPAGRSPCLFLHQGRCLIYPVRPLRCRAQFSPDAEACRQSYLGRRETMPLLSEPALLYHSLRTGLRLGLREAGMYDAPLRLSAGVTLALKEPGVLARWLAERESALEAVRYPQAADEERLLRQFARQARRQAEAEKETMRQVIAMLLQRPGAWAAYSTNGVEPS